jgi:hypothetical protein
MNCTICDTKLEVDNGDLIGRFGGVSVGFCVWCISCLTKMMTTIDGRFIVLEKNEFSECCNYPALYKLIDNTIEKWDFCGKCLECAEFIEKDIEE